MTPEGAYLLRRALFEADGHDPAATLALLDEAVDDDGAWSFADLSAASGAQMASFTLHGSGVSVVNILTTNGYVSRYVTDWAGPQAQIRTIAMQRARPTMISPVR